MAAKSKRGGYRQRDPSGIALGDLNKSLERYPVVDISKRQSYLEELKEYPYLTNINMLMMSATLVLLDKLPETSEFSVYGGTINPYVSIQAFFQVENPNFPDVIENVPGRNYNHDLPITYNNQDLYNYITYPILNIINDKAITREHIPEILIKTRGTLYQYSNNLIKYRTPE